MVFALGGSPYSLFNIHASSLFHHSFVLLVKILKDEQVPVSESLVEKTPESSPKRIKLPERRTRIHPVPTTKGAKRWGKHYTGISQQQQQHVGNRTPPTGGSEVLQADEYIKGLLLWTVQSFSCCFNAACPVPSVEQVSYWILRPWMAHRPYWGRKYYTQSVYTQWSEKWTNKQLASCILIHTGYNCI